MADPNLAIDKMLTMWQYYILSIARYVVLAHMSKFFSKLSFYIMRASLKVLSRLAPVSTGRFLARRFVIPEKASRTLAINEISTLAGVEKKYLTLGGVDVCIYYWGDPREQPYVLLSHGWSSFGLRFSAWVPELRALGYAVISFDQAGHGLSGGKACSIPQFTDILRSIGRYHGAPAVFIGHSLGASSIVFADEPSWRPDRYILMAPMISPGESARRQFVKFKISFKAFDTFENQLYQWTGKRFADFDATSMLSKFSRPALIIHDRDDRQTPWEEGARFTALWRGAEIFSTQGLGHNRMLDNLTVMERVTSFIPPATPSEPREFI